MSCHFSPLTGDLGRIAFAACRAMRLTFFNLGYLLLLVGKGNNLAQDNVIGMAFRATYLPSWIQAPFFFYLLNCLFIAFFCLSFCVCCSAGDARLVSPYIGAQLELDLDLQDFS